MKTEVTCGNCGAVWHLEGHADGEMLCPACLARIKFGRQRPRPLGGLPESVVCPRCNLHFSPFSKRSRPGGRRSVLVIESQKYFREIVADALEPVFDVRTADSADAAAAALATGGIDLIVLDLEIDGNDGARRLLGKLAPKPCPIVVCTARDESELYGKRWEELQRCGADDVVIKGMNAGESLLRKAAALLGTSVEELEAPKPIG